MVKKYAQQEATFDSNDLSLGEFLAPLVDSLKESPDDDDDDDDDVEIDSDIEEGDLEVEDKEEEEDNEDDHQVSEEALEDDGIVFVLDSIPGAPGADEVELEPSDEVVLDSDVSPEETDKWKWQPSNFLEWLKGMFDNVPGHSGYDTTGLEKAISYFEVLDKEITKAMRTDFKNEIDSAKAESAREQIENGLERLVDRLEKVKKNKFKRHSKKSKAWAELAGLVKNSSEETSSDDLVKEASKAVKITGITITVPLLISRLARVCINAMVSAGHDIEDVFQAQVKEYDLDKREQAELSQLLSDMGYGMIQDRGYPVGTQVNTYENNFDWAANYKG